MRRQEFLQLHLARDLATHSDFHCCRPRPAEPTMRSLTRRHKVRRQLLLAGDLATHSFWHAFHHTRQCWATCFLWLLWQYFLGTLETQWVKTLMQQGNRTTEVGIHAMESSDNQGRPCENELKNSALVLLRTVQLLSILRTSYNSYRRMN